jgi:glycosyltransferase involved in cell wall biosynthesis
MNGGMTEKALRIGLDLVNLAGVEDGLGRYAVQLVRSLAGSGPGPEFVLFVREELAGCFGPLPQGMRAVPLRVPRRRFVPWNQLAFLRRGRLAGLDILHSPVSVPPLALPNAGPEKIVTVHDLAFLVDPASSSARSKAWWNFSWPRALQRAAHIVAVSEQTKRDLVSHLSLPADKISVIYPYVSFPNADVPGDVMRRARDRFRLPDRYILHVGARHKRKNVRTLVEAFRLLKQDPSFTHALVLAGPRGWDDDALLRATNGEDLKGNVVFTGFVADADLPGVYAGADVLVFPSLYEGFGYPPLEAMACGTPVVVSNLSCLPEVAGEAALLVPPLDARAVADGILQVLKTPGLANRLREAGRRRVRTFSKERLAREYLDVYQNVAARRSEGQTSRPSARTR